MVLRGALAVELHCFLHVFARAPSKFIAKRGAVSSFRMTVFGGCDEEGKGAVVVFYAFVEEAGGVAVG